MNPKWCVNYNGVLETSCRAGVFYRDFWPKLVKDWPCHLEGGGSCAHRRFPTEEELKKDKAEWDEVLRQTVAVMKAIGESKGGKMPCPRCGTGIISYGRSSFNNHLHFRCSTEKCLAMME